jgi:hypothetical protein
VLIRALEYLQIDDFAKAVAEGTLEPDVRLAYSAAPALDDIAARMSAFGVDDWVDLVVAAADIHGCHCSRGLDVF